MDDLAPLALIEVSDDAEGRAALAAAGAMVEGGRPGWIAAMLPYEDVGLLEGAGATVVLRAEDARSLRPAVGARGGAGYHDAAAVLTRLRDLAADAPSRVAFVDLGSSVDGRMVGGVVVGAGAAPKPALRVLGGHHGDEWSSVEVALALAVTLAEGEDPRAASLSEQFEIWVVPDINPDGHEAFERRNAAGVDLNRNYAFEWQGASWAGDGPFSEPETRIVEALSMRRSFGLSISVHSGATNLGWPWNHTEDPSADDALFRSLAEPYIAACGVDGFWITQGSHWYTTRGDTNDWSYGWFGGLDLTLEVSLEKAPPEEDLPALRAAHVDAMLGLLEQGAATAIHGRLTDDAGVGLPLAVRAENGWWTAADPNTGLFVRPFPADTSAVSIGHTDAPAWQVIETGAPADLGVIALSASTPPWDRLRSGIDADGHLWAVAGGGEVSTLLDATAFWFRPGERWDAVLQPGPGTDTVALRSLLPFDGRAGPVHLGIEGTDNTTTFLSSAVISGELDPTAGMRLVDGQPNPLTLTMPELPEGSDIRVVGPDGRTLPPELLHRTASGAQLDLAGWPKGDYLVRWAGGGRWGKMRGLIRWSADGALLVDDGPQAPPAPQVVDRRSPFRGDPTPDEPRPQEPPPPIRDEDTGTGCSGGAAGFVVPWWVRRSRRRRIGG